MESYHPPAAPHASKVTNHNGGSLHVRRTSLQRAGVVRYLVGAENSRERPDTL